MDQQSRPAPRLRPRLAARALNFSTRPGAAPRALRGRGRRSLVLLQRRFQGAPRAGAGQRRTVEPRRARRLSRPVHRPRRGLATGDGGARYEHYSDFGSTHQRQARQPLPFSPEVSARASISSGFRLAPSLAQLTTPAWASRRPSPAACWRSTRRPSCSAPRTWSRKSRSATTSAWCSILCRT
ncbi:hypothetical protein P4123_11480 [Pseudomonas aeruginosa]|nr:hypothetical protein [Pseudomonas aeruginosa]